VIVVEVTLTDNSRQEAAEGEPVRRHVADLVSHYGGQTCKPVYGLFIANRIDSNTAETFRIGAWYTRADEKMRLDIIPVTLL
jgi:AlwI restriction endonuclease